MINVLSIDVEDYFQVSAFERYVKREDWSDYPLRVVDNTQRILDLLNQSGVTATFFVLGWVAKRCPSLVKNIHNSGHEIASHGFGHQRVSTQSQQEFREDVRTSKALLEDLIGQAVLGYRAPSYSISMNSLWAFDELAEAGYLYDSSVFPVKHDFYGIPDWPRFPFIVLRGADGKWSPTGTSSDDGYSECNNNAKILEIPITTLNLGRKNIPIGGGGYFRFFPYTFTKWGLRRINRIDKRPFVFYLHPWEIDPAQPKMPEIDLKTRFRHYLNLGKTEQRFCHLLSDFKFSSMRNLAEAYFNNTK
jgi:polysaccharide deacetylase family protein (PEP-CTERM system associated)